MRHPVQTYLTLISVIPYPFAQQDSNGATPLHYAVEADSLEAVEVLMRRPEVRDQPDLRGRTALMWAAAATGACDMIRAMCRHGSDLGYQVST